jgi:hypothetical protein
MPESFIERIFRLTDHLLSIDQKSSPPLRQDAPGATIAVFPVQHSQSAPRSRLRPGPIDNFQTIDGGRSDDRRRATPGACAARSESAEG